MRRESVRSAGKARSLSERRPRLLYVVTLAEVGGAQSYVRDLLPAVREEFDVTVAAHGEGPLRDYCSENGIAFVPLHRVRRDISPLSDVLGLLELVRLFRRLRPDLIHLNSSKAGALGRVAGALTRVPARVFTAHGWAFEATSGLGGRLYLWADRLARPLTSMVVCVSKTDYRSGLAARTCTATRARVIPNAVDVGFVPDRTARRDDPVEILSIGRLADQKNFPALIAAASQLPAGAARIRILGDGPQRDHLRALIAEHGLEETVELVGEVSNVRDYLAQADMFVLSTHYEGMPLAVLEAMAAGLPVVVSAVSGLHEVVLDGTSGLLVSPDDPTALAEALARLIDDRDLREELGRGARRLAEERYSLGPWRAAHLDLYRTLLKAAPRDVAHVPRLLYVVTLAEVGGAQSYVRDLAPAMAEQFDVAVAAHGEGPLKDFCERNDIAFVSLRHVRRDISVVRDFLGLVELIRLFRRLRPDIVHLNSSKAGVLGRLAGSYARVPVRVFTAHGWAFKATTGLGARVYLWADRLVRPLTTMIVCVSHIEREAGLAARTCTAARSCVIPNAVDVDSVLPRVPNASEPARILSVGRLAEPKDFPTLIAAMALVPRGRASLRILGDGPQRELLQTMMVERALEGSVELVGEVADVRPYLAESDVFVLSTTSEGMPLAVLEAMAAGLPAVVSAVSGLHEVVLDGETGILVPADDAEALAAGMLRLVDDAALRERLGRAARHRAEEHFALGPWREAHLELYQSLDAAPALQPA